MQQPRREKTAVEDANEVDGTHPADQGGDINSSDNNSLQQRQKQQQPSNFLQVVTQEGAIEQPAKRPKASGISAA